MDVADNGEHGLWNAPETGHDVITLDVLPTAIDPPTGQASIHTLRGAGYLSQGDHVR